MALLLVLAGLLVVGSRIDRIIHSTSSPSGCLTFDYSTLVTAADILHTGLTTMPEEERPPGDVRTSVDCDDSVMDPSAYLELSNDDDCQRVKEAAQSVAVGRDGGFEATCSSVDGHYFVTVAIGTPAGT